jgi:protoporphyrinogen oxidase
VSTKSKTNIDEPWAVVGGGMLGMTIAHRLAKSGKRVELFEAAPYFGGLASAWQLGDVTWDRHYHVTLLSDFAIRALLDELGLEKEIDWVQTRTGFYTDGQLYSMSNSVEFLRFPPLNIVDKVRLGATIFYASRVKDWSRLEKIAVSDWLRRLSGKRNFEKIWLPLLRSKLGESYRRTSAAFIWATIARMYAARRTGLKKEMFGYVPGGYARVLEKYSKLLVEEGVRLNSSTKVDEVKVKSDGRLALLNGSTLLAEFKNVVITAPAPAAADVCDQLQSAERERLRNIEYQGIVCASLLLKRPLADFYVTNITDTLMPFTAVIEMSALVRKTHFGGNNLVYLPKYVDSGDPIFDEPDEEIRERFVCALEKMYSQFSRDDVLAFRVSRVRNVFPLQTLDYSSRLPSMNSSVKGLFFVNSSQIVNGTLNVNETVLLANRFIETINAHEGSDGERV